MRSLLLSTLTISICAQAFCQPPGDSQPSNYVRRMMTVLDKNKDGLLTAQELPSKLKELLKFDRNKDGAIDVEELAASERKALSERNTNDAQSPSNTRKGRRGRGIVNNNSTRRGNPLDPAQIIRFAKTFDSDKNGILSAAELKKYARALAARRTRDSDKHTPSTSTTDKKAAKTPPAGLSATDRLNDSDPFGPPKQTPQ